MMAFRVASSRFRLMHLLEYHVEGSIFQLTEKLIQLREELASEFQAPIFLKSRSMGQLVKRQLKQTLQKNLALIQKNLGKFQD